MLRRIVHNFATRLATALFNFSVVWLTAHYLGATGRGTVSLFITDSALLLLFIGLLGGSSLIYLAPRRNIWHLLLPAYFWAGMVCIAGSLAIGLIRQPDSYYLLHLAAVSLCQAFFSINTSLLLGRRQETAYNWLMLLQVGLLAGALLFAFGTDASWRSVSMYYYSTYLATGIPMLLSFGMLQRLPDRRQRMGKRLRATIRELARHSRKAHFSNILAFANYRLSYYFVAHYANIREVGVLSIGVALMEAIWLIPRSTALVQYVDLVNSTTVDRLPDSALRVARLTVLGVTMAVLVLLAVPAASINYVFGAEFGAVQPVMLLLAPGTIVMAVQMLVSSYFAGIARYRINNAASMVGLAVTLAACYFLIPIYGIKGAALASTLSYSTSTAFLLFYFYRATKAGVSSFIPRFADITHFWHLVQQRVR